ncbi:FAD-binding protein [Paenibacillus sp. p3-SID867]|nr:FAD-binding protein [Paenibacillus sp. p3-SID867]MCT1401055.1 FAD-binding protein [Paenibacillus sp. p3-SID867]
MLGGLQTDLTGRVLNANGEPVSGLYAVGRLYMDRQMKFSSYRRKVYGILIGST